MLDALYVVGTILFFVLMIAYTAACNRIGRRADVERAQKDAR